MGRAFEFRKGRKKMGGQRWPKHLPELEKTS
jgi:hypothetical protein